MQAKHTPGPWATYYHEATDTYTIHVAGRNWEKWAVAHVGYCTQDEANARFIAAAPDLLENLRQLADLLESIGHDCTPAREVIARATGA